MAELDDNLHYDYGNLVEASVKTLLVNLAETHSAISNLHIRIAFLRNEELRGQKSAKEQRNAYEGLLNAYIEKKWLLVKLLEHHPHV